MLNAGVYTCNKGSLPAQYELLAPEGTGNILEPGTCVHNEAGCKSAGGPITLG